MIHKSSDVTLLLKDLRNLVYKYHREKLANTQPSLADVDALIMQVARHHDYNDGFWRTICSPVSQDWIAYVTEKAPSIISWIKSGGNFKDNKGNIIGLPHLFATIDGYNSLLSLIPGARKEWAGWMGDLAQVTCQVLSEIDTKYYGNYDYLISYATNLIGNTQDVSSFSSNDIYCDIDGENIHNMITSTIRLVEAFDTYYNINNRYLSRFDIFIVNMGEDTAFYEMMKGPSLLIYKFIKFNNKTFTPTDMQRGAINGVFANYVLTRQFKTN